MSRFPLGFVFTAAVHLMIAAPAEAQSPSVDLPREAVTATDGDEDDRIYACYVRGAGTMYLVRSAGAPDACNAANHVLFGWNEQWDVSLFQRRVAASCAQGSTIRAILEDGSVTCEPDDDAAAGVDFSAFQLRIQPCGEGSTIRAVHADGAVACEVDDVADTSGLQGRVTQACPHGTAMVAIAADGSVTCRVDRTGFVWMREGVRTTNAAGSPTADLGSTQGRVCFLVYVELEDIDSGGEISECRLETSSGRWRLRARAPGDDNDARCNAQCLSWSAST